MNKWIPILIIILALGMLYGLTIAPGLSWAHDSADSGDLITAAATFGVAHPPGYPTYLLLAELFQLIPIGSIAFRTNLLSAVVTILAAVLLYLGLLQWPASPLRGQRLACLVVGLAYGLAPLIWSLAVVTEVYALHGLFVVILLWLLFYPSPATQPARDRLDFIRGFIPGLAAGNHLTIVLLFPLLLGLDGIVKRSAAQPDNGNTYSLGRGLFKGSWRLDWKVVALRTLGLLLGLSIYLTLMLRAHTGSPVNWGNPGTLKNLWWLISGRLYTDRLFTLPLPYLLPRLSAWIGLMLAQIGLPGLVVALYGLFFCKSVPPRIYLVSGWLFLSYSIYALGYDTLDSYAYLVPAVIPLVLWSGLGLADLMRLASSRARWLAPALGLAALIYLGGYAGIHYSTMDASKDLRADAYAQTVLDDAPSDAIIFTSGDKATFSLWYYHYVLHQRPDIAVLVTTMLPYDWYRETIQVVYPGLVISNPAGGAWETALVAANSSRPICETSFMDVDKTTCHE